MSLNRVQQLVKLQCVRSSLLRGAGCVRTNFQYYYLELCFVVFLAFLSFRLPRCLRVAERQTWTSTATMRWSVAQAVVPRRQNRVLSLLCSAVSVAGCRCSCEPLHLLLSPSPFFFSSRSGVRAIAGYGNRFPVTAFDISVTHHLHRNTLRYAADRSGYQKAACGC